MEDLKIKEILIERGYPENAATAVAPKFSKLTGELKAAAAEWLSTGNEIEISSNGYSTKSLMAKFPGMAYPAALLTIDWLEREPEKAKQAIARGVR